jgi:hypothetical protein
MKPQINNTKFGSIKVDGKKYKHDIYITLDGKVSKRKKKLSKAIYGSSHTIALDEIQYFFDDQADGIVIGTGQYGVAKLSFEADEFLHSKNCRIHLLPTPRAIDEWNTCEGKLLGLFHVTC